MNVIEKAGNKKALAPYQYRRDESVSSAPVVPPWLPFNPNREVVLLAIHHHIVARDLWPLLLVIALRGNRPPVPTCL